MRGIKANAARLPRGYSFTETVDLQQAADVLSVCFPHDLATVANMEVRTRQVMELNGYTEHMLLGIVAAGRLRRVSRLVACASLAYAPGQEGSLAELAVLPEHRHKGLAKALVDMRVAVADAHEVHTLDINLLEPGNVLAGYYRQRHGFAEEMVESADGSQRAYLCRYRPDSPVA